VLDINIPQPAAAAPAVRSMAPAIAPNSTAPRPIAPPAQPTTTGFVTRNAPLPTVQATPIRPTAVGAPGNPNIRVTSTPPVPIVRQTQQIQATPITSGIPSQAMLPPSMPETARPQGKTMVTAPEPIKTPQKVQYSQPVPVKVLTGASTPPEPIRKIEE